ncbi:hypothetical protein PENSPDRAFT_693617 [Peniophora sp. CONT]|nr:hypothetical protein PENSPDRAFT_693617 [Peniophora sp. CONT]
MFPISCNAFGDIVAVVQIVHDIVVALDGARGAAEEYRQFIHVLSALGAVMDGVYCLAKDSQDENLKQIVLEEVRRCCVDINSAHSSVARFEKLEETSSGLSAGGIITKLHWHFRKASDAAKYAKRFGESHQRLNSFIGLLGPRSTSQIIEVQHLRSLQAAQDHNRAVLQAVRDQEHTILRSTEEIKAVALAAIQQASLQSRQHIVEQVLTRPFLTSAQDRRVASRAKRVTDMIFDSLAPQTPAAQRDRFLSLLAPIFVAGAALVAQTHVSSQWHSIVFLPAICALLVQVLWLQSSTPMYAGFNHENAIFLVDFFGDKITVPFQFCRTSEMFHRFLDLLYSDSDNDAMTFVRSRLYELYLRDSSQLISSGNWLSYILPGACLEMGIILVPALNTATLCPYCQCKYDVKAGYEVIW